MTRYPQSRRIFIHRSIAWITGVGGFVMLGGCGSEGNDTKVTPLDITAIPSTVAGSDLSNDDRGLNFALNFEYLAAQFYAYAADGAGLDPALLSGVGKQGADIGARVAALSVSSIAAAAADLAMDKAAHVSDLRKQLGAAVAAIPALDLSVAPEGAFALIARKGGLSAGSAFDPYAGDSPFLLGATMMEYALAANYRTLLTNVLDPIKAGMIEAILARSIYHGGLVRTLLDERTIIDPILAADAKALCFALAQIDGSNGGVSGLTGADDGSADLLDAAGRPLPFLRGPAQMLRIGFLNMSGAVGGFFPHGLNGTA